MSLGGPSASASAVIIGSAVPSFCHGAMPVMTAESSDVEHRADDQAHDDPERHVLARDSCASSAAVEMASNPI